MLLYMFAALIYAFYISFLSQLSVYALCIIQKIIF